MSDQYIQREECPHAGEIQVTDARAAKCARCDVTEHLRLCTSCGQVFCCESDNAHNREHFKETGHPIIMSHGLLPHRFTWCWACSAYLSE